MATQSTLTCTFYVGGVKVEKLSEEQLEKMSQRMGKAMSIYYTANPKEYLRIKEK